LLFCILRTYRELSWPMVRSFFSNGQQNEIVKQQWVTDDR
jgi:hypothetical protein